MQERKENSIHEESAQKLSGLPPLLRDLHTSGSAQRLLHVAVNRKLAGGQGTDHEQPSTDTSIAASETQLLSDLDQAAGGALSREALGLVDLREHGVGGLGDDGGGETGDQTGTQVDGCLQRVGGGRLVELLPRELGDLLVDDEFGHCVGNSVLLLVSASMPSFDIWGGLESGEREGGKDVLLEQDRTKASVERTHTLILQHLAEATDEAIRICRLGHETDTCGLEGAERDVGEELGERSRREVDGGAVVGGSLVSEVVDGLLLEQLVPSELERALQEVTCGCRAEACREGAPAFISNYLSNAAEEASVICDGVELDSGLDAVWRRLSVGRFLLLSRGAWGQVAKCRSREDGELTRRRE
jgi:hypothetical protein